MKAISYRQSLPASDANALENITLIDKGQIKTTVAHQLGTINAENLIKAHAMLESQQAHGKIVLEGF